jgi:hypothetical protein
LPASSGAGVIGDPTEGGHRTTAPRLRGPGNGVAGTPRG